MIAWRRLALVIALAVALAAPAAAENAREILDRRRTLDDTTRQWSDREQNVELTIEKKGGATQRRTLTIYERKLPEREEQSLLFFESPATIKGVGFLSYSHRDRPDDQWLYLPALKRVRSIAAGKQQRSDSFVGTDLTYHDLDVLQDMTSWSAADAPSALLGEDVVGGVPSHRIELRPGRDDVYYERIVLWLGKDDLVARRTEFFQAAATPVKRVEQSDVRSVDGIPVPHRLEAATLDEQGAAKSKTVMIVHRVRFNQRLEPDLFTQRALARGSR
jgi:hypothetical protein